MPSFIPKELAPLRFQLVTVAAASDKLTGGFNRTAKVTIV